jgi:hypothetical protein
VATPRTEIGLVRQRLQEQLGDHRGHAVHVAGSRRAAEAVGQRRNRDPGGKAVRIDLLDRRREQEVDTQGVELADVAGLVARIAGQIVRLVELFGIHEDRRDHPVALAARPAHQLQVPLVQRAHGRHDADALAGAAPAGDRPAQLGDAAQNGQRRLASPPGSRSHRALRAGIAGIAIDHGGP